ncbi:unnamed protein product [Nesidiocoris tenuis]|uniref:Uncharacterized protein n=1 Tax=Nesidiocoris tenuis TaxID=355587 RepID=A0A6H5HPR2_9HEMI|nr:unnamed protein product [Nesidiocoris tenuis]CAB0019985.1 unnamed protein product [Nesidiocoris tenuis]
MDFSARIHRFSTQIVSIIFADFRQWLLIFKNRFPRNRASVRVQIRRLYHDTIDDFLVFQRILDRSYSADEFFVIGHHVFRFGRRWDVLIYGPHQYRIDIFAGCLRRNSWKSGKNIAKAN